MTSTLSTLCINTLAAHPKYMDFTKLDTATIGKLQRRLYNDSVNVAVIHKAAFGAIYMAHYKNLCRASIVQPETGYIRLHVRVKYGDNPMITEATSVGIGRLRGMGFIIEEIDYMSNITDEHTISAITNITNTNYNGIYYSSDIGVGGDLCSGKSYSDDILYILESDATRRIRRMYPTLMSPPLSVPRCGRYISPPAVENTLYEKVMFYLLNNLNIVNFTILPEDIVDDFVQRLNAKNKQPTLRGYLIRGHTMLSTIYAIEYKQLPSRQAQGDYGMRVIQNDSLSIFKYEYNTTDKLDISEVDCEDTEWDALNITPYNNHIARNIHNVYMYRSATFNVNLDTNRLELYNYTPLEGIDATFSIEDIDEYADILFIKSAPESTRLYNKYRHVDGIRLISDLVDIPVQLLL